MKDPKKCSDNQIVSTLDYLVDRFNAVSNLADKAHAPKGVFDLLLDWYLSKTLDFQNEFLIRFGLDNNINYGVVNTEEDNNDKTNL